jgi:hypothetical protein
MVEGSVTIELKVRIDLPVRHDKYVRHLASVARCTVDLPPTTTNCLAPIVIDWGQRLGLALR